MAAVIQPLLKPREIPELDAFTTFWAAYTGARSAKWEQRVNLLLQQMDSGRMGELIDDLRRRRDSLEAEQYRLQRGQIGSVEDYESDVRRAASRSTSSSGSRTSRSNINSYAAQVGSFRRHNARERARVGATTARVSADLDREEAEQQQETIEFMEMIDRSRYGGQTVAVVRQNPGAEGTVYSQAIAGLGQPRGDAAQRQYDANLMSMYYAAVEAGHTQGAAIINQQLRARGGAGGVLNERTTTVQEMQANRERELNAIEPGAYVSSSDIYAEARRQHAIDNPGEEFREDVVAAPLPGAPRSATGEPIDESAYQLYGTQAGQIGQQIAALDAQIARLTLADQASRDQNMNQLQSMLNQNWNFAPFALTLDEDTQEFMDLMAETGDPQRFAAFQEGVDEFGSVRGFNRAQDRGEASPYDPRPATSVTEFASGDQGSFIFGHFYDEIQGVEQELREDPSRIGFVFGQMMRIGTAANYMNLFGREADYFREQFSGVGSRLTPFSTDGGDASETAMGQMYMAMGYLQREGEGGVVYRQYGDGTYKESRTQMDGQPAGFVNIDVEDVPENLFGAVPGTPNVASFDGFDTTRDDLPVSIQAVFEELAETKELAREEMGGSDVLFGQLLSFSLNEAMAEDDETNRLRLLYANATLAGRLPQSLVGDRGRILRNTLEVRSAEGDKRGLFRDIDRIIDAGERQDVIDRAYREYTQEYGTIARGQTSEQRVDDAGNVYNVITPVEVTSDEPLSSVDERAGREVSTALGVPTDVGRGVIPSGDTLIDIAARPESERSGPFGVNIPIYSEGGRNEELRLLREEAVSLRRRREAVSPQDTQQLEEIDARINTIKDRIQTLESRPQDDALERTVAFETQEERQRAIDRLRAREVNPRGNLMYPEMPGSELRPSRFRLTEEEAAEREALMEELLQRTRDMEDSAAAQGMQYTPLEAISEEDRSRMEEIRRRIEEIDTAPPSETVRPVPTAEQRRQLEQDLATSTMQDLEPDRPLYTPEGQPIAPPPPSEPLLASLRSIPYLVARDEDSTLRQGNALRLEGAIRGMQSATDQQEIVANMQDAIAILEQQLTVSEELEQETLEDVQRRRGLPQNRLRSYGDDLKETIRENASRADDGVDPFTQWNMNLVNAEERLEAIVQEKIVARARDSGHDVQTYEDVEQMALDTWMSRRNTLFADFDERRNAVAAIEADIVAIRQYPSTRDIDAEDMETLLEAVSP